MKTIDLESVGKSKKASYRKFIKNFDNANIKDPEKKQVIDILLPKAKRLVKLDDETIQARHTKNEYNTIMLTTVRLLNKLK